MSRITLSRAYQSSLACHLPLRNQPHVGIGTASHISMRLVLVGDSFIPKGPWELLWLVQARQPVFWSVKLAPIKYEKSFVLRHMKSDEGLFWKSRVSWNKPFDSRKYSQGTQVSVKFIKDARNFYPRYVQCQSWKLKGCAFGQRRGNWQKKKQSNIDPHKSTKKTA